MATKAPGPPKSTTPSSGTTATLRALYSAMQSIENRLGGGEGVEGLYGSITCTGTQKVLAAMSKHCGLDKDSVLVDIGAGLGRPLLHALIEPGVKATHGVELDQIKVDKAHAFLKQTAQRLQARGLVRADMALPTMQCAAIEQVAQLTDCTHAYSFWEGVPPPGRAAFGRLFRSSPSLRGVAVVQRAMRTDPEAAMAAMGFGPLLLRASFPVSMSGSGRSFTAYIFQRSDGGSEEQQPEAAPSTSVPEEVPTPCRSQDDAVVPAEESSGFETRDRPDAALTARQSRASARRTVAVHSLAGEEGCVTGPPPLGGKTGAARCEGAPPQQTSGRQPGADAAASMPKPMPPQHSAELGATQLSRAASTASASTPKAPAPSPVKQTSCQRPGVKKKVSPVKPATARQGRLPLLRRAKPSMVTTLNKALPSKDIVANAREAEEGLRPRAARGLAAALGRH
ncbi:hypothetical protein ACKKBG_A38890 [Auxenochlorella protothecoides x Auxenochlorella symbiontica]